MIANQGVDLPFGFDKQSVILIGNDPPITSPRGAKALSLFPGLRDSAGNSIPDRGLLWAIVSQMLSAPLE
jgi:hypothetical protein